MKPSDEDRISYLAGDAGESLSGQDRAALDELRESLRSPASWEVPDPELGDRIVVAITLEAGERSGGESTRRWRALRPASATGTGATGATGATRRTARRLLRERLAARRPALALSLLVAVAAAILVVTGLGDNSPGPEQFAMVVLGTPLAPNAHGSATLTKTTSGWRIALSAPGLPHLQGAVFYEAWLKDRAGTLVPVGTFNDARKVTLWSGVPVTKFRTLTVTRQRAGSFVSSGQRVLTGTIR